jgi:hypothetical protein
MQSDIGSMQGDISSVKEALSRIETRMDERFDAIMSLLQGLKE